MRCDYMRTENNRLASSQGRCVETSGEGTSQSGGNNDDRRTKKSQSVIRLGILDIR